MTHNKTGFKIDWGFDHLGDVIMPLTNVQRTADQQAFTEPTVERSKAILDACLKAQSRLNLFIENLQSEINGEGQ